MIQPEKSPSHRLAPRLGRIQAWMGVYQAQFCNAPLSACSECVIQDESEANVGTTSDRLQGAHWSIGEEAELMQSVSGSAPLDANSANAD